VPFPLYFENGKVGIGEQTPEVELDVVGDVDVSGDVEIAGSLTVAGGAVTGITLQPVGAVPNANGATLASGDLTLQPASATLPGVVTAGAQTFGGAKTFAAATTLTTGVVNSSVADGASAVAFELDTAALSTAGTKMVSFRNNNVEKLAIDKDGMLRGTFATPQFVDLSYAGNGVWVGTGSNLGGSVVLGDNNGRSYLEATSAAINIGSSLNPTVKLVMRSSDSTGTPGNATINRASGRSAIAAAASAVTITNSLVTASSIVVVTPRDLDGTLTRFTAVAGTGSFVVTGNAAATADWDFDWIIFN
jgi:hypothetical protein